ncbi:MAG: hypothetical protein AB7N80_11035 [Bdellovibrionales bacterium]
MRLISVLMSLMLAGPALANDFSGEVDGNELQIDLSQYRGVGKKTKNNQYVKAQFERGVLSGGFFCTREGMLNKVTHTLSLYCSDEVRTISDDDNEAMSFRIEQRTQRRHTQYLITQIDCAGACDFFEDEMTTLLGEGWRHLPDDTLYETTIELKPISRRRFAEFLPAETVAYAAKPQVGKSVLIQDGSLRVTLPITKFDFRIDPNFEVLLTASLGNSQNKTIRVPRELTVRFSILKTTGQFDSGLKDVQTIEQELRRLLKIQGR